LAVMEKTKHLRKKYKILFGRHLWKTSYPMIENYFTLKSTTRKIKNKALRQSQLLHQNQNIFFSNIGNQNIFLEQGPFRSLLVKHAHGITSGSSSSSLHLKYDLNCTHILLIFHHKDDVLFPALWSHLYQWTWK
jgi:hypothetical protein